MDHAGAMTGPLVAAALLWWGGACVRCSPGRRAGGAQRGVLLLKCERRRANRRRTARLGGGEPAPLGPSFRLPWCWPSSPWATPDAFLLLRAQEAGVPLTAIPLWAFHHAVKSAFSTWE